MGEMKYSSSNTNFRENKEPIFIIFCSQTHQQGPHRCHPAAGAEDQPPDKQGHHRRLRLRGRRDLEGQVGLQVGDRHQTSQV